MALVLVTNHSQDMRLHNSFRVCTTSCKHLWLTHAVIGGAQTHIFTNKNVNYVEYAWLIFFQLFRTHESLRLAAM